MSDNERDHANPAADGAATPSSDDPSDLDSLQEQARRETARAEGHDDEETEPAAEDDAVTNKGGGI